MRRLVVMLALALVAGCYSPRVVYVPADRKVVAMEHEGVEGYFVPTATMADIVRRLELQADRELIRSAFP